MFSNLTSATIKKFTLALIVVFGLVITPVVLYTCGKSGNAAFGQPSVKGTVTIPKKCVEMDSLQWLNKVQYLNYVVQRLRASDLPSKETSFMIDSLIYPLQAQIIQQVVNKK